MCGICGKISLSQKRINKKEIKKMSDILAHRGPDGEGFYISPDKKVGLGHRRLAIIDLKTGDQPMSNEDGTCWVAFNGEIYNFLQIRKDLKKRGHIFKTKSDTEVIIHAYEEYGFDCLRYFNGMFALAIWDEKKKILFLARDRLGKKPLFYCQTPQSFIFASEIKAILQNQEIKKKIDLEALSMYFSLGYFLAPLTIIKDIKKLPAASFLIFQKREIKIREYWDFNPTKKEELTEKEWILKFKDIFKKSIRNRLVSDVSLGAFLSGGIDSTSVVSFMPHAKGLNPKTLSIGFKEPTYSELPYAQKAAKFLKTEHQYLIVKPDIKTVLPKIVWFNDEPLGDTSAVPMYFLSQMTRKKVKVALSGDGGDENLAGYETYVADKLFPFYQKIPLAQFITDLIVRFLPTSFDKVSFDYKLKQFVKAKGFTPEKAHYFWRIIFTDEEKKKLFKKSFLKKIKNIDTFIYFKKYFDKYKSGDFLSRAQYVDIKTWLVDDILVKVDRTSMAHSLEVRAPFLDYQLVEFLAQAPTDLKLNGFNKKYLLKKAMSGLIPQEIISRPKAGFNAPISMWLKNELKDLVLSCLSEEKIGKRGLFNYKFIKKLLDDYFSERKDNSLKIWLLLNFIIWEKMFLDQV